MLLRWKSASLRSQLVAIIMGLLLLALAATGAGTLTLVKSYLQGQVDDKLKAAVALALDQQSFDKLAPPNPATDEPAQPNPEAPTESAVPTDYSLTLYVPGFAPYPYAGSQSDRPAIANITPAEAKLRGNSPPFQVKGTAGTNWRVVAIGVRSDGGQNGVMIIGLPLTPVDKVMEHAVLVVVASAY